MHGERPSYVGWRGLAVAAGLAVNVKAARLTAARRGAGSSKRYGAALGKAVPFRGGGPGGAGPAAVRPPRAWGAGGANLSLSARGGPRPRPDAPARDSA